jgi:hypothetical protein
MGRRITLALGLLILAAEAHAAADGGFSLSILIDGSPAPEFRGNGKVYIEAIHDRPYQLRLTNPFPYRVAVALSVDGLNTLDAKHTDSGSARKWVLDPYETATIPGWQVSSSAAREFFFTGEKKSYGALLGKTENLGVIEAVFFRERQPYPVPVPYSMRSPAPSGVDGGVPRRDAVESESPSLKTESGAKDLSDEYAATGMGRRDEHSVYEIDLDLERRPAASIRIRYEFRPQLVKLGVLPERLDPLDRREGASGFFSYCPETR